MSPYDKLGDQFHINLAKEIVERARDTNTQDAFKVIHNAARGHDELGSVNDALDMDTVTRSSVRLASQIIRGTTQRRLRAQGAPETMTMFRQGGVVAGQDVVALSGKRLSHWPEAKEYTVERRHVLTDPMWSHSFTEQEHHVPASKLGIPEWTPEDTAAHIRKITRGSI